MAQEKLAEAERAHVAATTEAERARAELEALRGDCTRADEAIAVARRVLADTETRLETLNRLQRSYAGAFAGVKAAMQWAEANGRSGFALARACRTSSCRAGAMPRTRSRRSNAAGKGGRPFCRWIRCVGQPAQDRLPAQQATAETKRCWASRPT
jgi:uncharacterized protein YPO0396